jgi:protein ImuB
MLRRLSERLGERGFTVRGAIAPTIGAAWALVHYSRQQCIDDNVEAALAPLPVAALRLEAAQIDSLTHLGLKRIGQLYGRNRRDMQARFGTGFLLRLDQALGWVEEKLAPRLPLAECFAEHRFADPIGLLDDVLMCTRDLAVQLSHRLEAMGMGAQAFHLFLYRVDHKVMTLSLNAARATRDADHIARLFANRAERLGGEYDAGFGIDMIRLAANSLDPLAATQIGAFGIEDGLATLDHLYDRMSSRLGPLAVVHAVPVNTHIPERAVRLAPVVAPQPMPAAMPPVVAGRPISLLPQPEPIVVLAEVPDAPPVSMIWRRVSYRFVKSAGPERISAEWRQAGARLALSAEAIEAAASGEQPGRSFEEGETARDYYVVEDEAGRRFWLFRLGQFGLARTPSWFLHGFFA